MNVSIYKCIHIHIYIYIYIYFFYVCIYPHLSIHICIYIHIHASFADQPNPMVLLVVCGVIATFKSSACLEQVIPNGYVLMVARHGRSFLRGILKLEMRDECTEKSPSRLACN